MTPEQFIQQTKEEPTEIDFHKLMSVIDEHYHYTPSAFSNGTLNNEAGQNEGSCKLFAFAKLHQLSEQETLSCFGDFYRKDVLENPKGESHQNIRNFMKTGWSGIQFDKTVLIEKN